MFYNKAMIIFIALFCLFSFGFCQQSKLCVDPEFHSFCDSIERELNVKCVKTFDSVDCVNKILNDEADFGRFNSEQSNIIASMQPELSVIAETRIKTLETRQHASQMVIVVRSNYVGGLSNLRRKKYCHPGFSYHDTWTPRFLKEFEHVLFKNELKQSCSKKENMSYIERELEILSSFFGESCRPGPWTRDINLNNYLKNKYSKLVALCDENESTPRSSLDCMKEKNADIAYTTFIEAQNLPDFENYRLLCRNGEITNISRVLQNECSWKNLPWPLIVGRRDKADDIQNKLIQWISKDYWAVTIGASPFSVDRAVAKPTENYLTKFITRNYEYRINIFNKTTNVQEFLVNNNQSTNLDADCPMRWCTTSEQEQEKCKWLSVASLYTGIEPQISCIPTDHIYDCLKKIQNDNADLIAIDANYGFLARKVKLQNLLYGESSQSSISSIVAVIREESSIKSFNDLKDKRACFPEYKGLAWISFIESAREHKIVTNNCDFEKSVVKLFKDICAPGAVNEFHRQRTGESKKLCSLCSGSCEANNDNIYFNNKGALSCLSNNNADIAFVEWQSIEKEPNLNNYRILCNNDEIIEFSNFENVKLKCALSNTVDSEIIVRENETRKIDYKHALLEMDKFFGIGFNNLNTFNMYKNFNGIENLLFKSNVLGLDDDSSDNIYVQNYIKLFENVDKCTSNAWITRTSSLTIYICSLIIFGIRYV